MKINEIKSNESKRYYSNKYNVRMVGLERGNQRIVGNEFDYEYIKKANTLVLVYRYNDELELYGEMPISIFADKDRTVFNNWFEELLNKYKLVTEDGKYMLGKLKTSVLIEVVYDEDYDVVEQSLVEFE